MPLLNDYLKLWNGIGAEPFDTKVASEALGNEPNVTRVLLSRMKSRDMIKGVKRGNYTLINPNFWMSIQQLESCYPETKSATKSLMKEWRRISGIMVNKTKNYGTNVLITGKPELIGEFKDYKYPISFVVIDPNTQFNRIVAHFLVAGGKPIYGMETIQKMIQREPAPADFEALKSLVKRDLSRVDGHIRDGTLSLHELGTLLYETHAILLMLKGAATKNWSLDELESRLAIDEKSGAAIKKMRAIFRSVKANKKVREKVDQSDIEGFRTYMKQELSSVRGIS